MTDAPALSPDGSANASSEKPSLRKLLSNSRRRFTKRGKGLGEPPSRRPVSGNGATLAVPSKRPEDGQAPSSTLSRSSGQPAEPIASTSALQGPQVDEAGKDRDADKEQASVTTTLTSAQTQTRRTDNKSEGAQSTAFAPSIAKPKLPSTRSKPSFLSRIMERVVPCTGHSRRQAVDDGSSAQSEANTVALREIPGTKVPEMVETPTMTNTAIAEPVASVILPTPPSDTSPAPEIEVIIEPPISAHTLPQSETDGLTSGAVQPPGSTGEIDPTHKRDSVLVDGSDGTRATGNVDDPKGADVEDDEEGLIRRGGAGIPIGLDGVPKPLLPPISPEHAGRKCLVLDLDETLVHSSFKAVQQADFIVPVEIEYHWHHFHVLKRPGVDNFLKQMGEIYEVVVYTASLSKYADPVLDKLDIHHAVTHRLFRESCYSHRGNYVKDLSQLGRPISDTIILDNSPASYIFHPNNAVPVSSWFNDPHDTELVDLVPFLADLTSVDDVRGILDGSI